MTDDCGKITTSMFRVPASHGANANLGAWADKHWLWLMLGLCGCVAAAIADWRWGIAIAAALLVIAPAVVAYIYYMRCLDPAQAMQLLPHCVEFSPQGIMLIFFADAEGKAREPISYAHGEIAEVAVEDKWCELRTRGPKPAISIPVSAFKSHADMMQALGFCPGREKIQCF